MSRGHVLPKPQLCHVRVPVRFSCACATAPFSLFLCAREALPACAPVSRKDCPRCVGVSQFFLPLPIGLFSLRLLLCGCISVFFVLIDFTIRVGGIHTYISLFHICHKGIRLARLRAKRPYVCAPYVGCVSVPTLSANGKNYYVILTIATGEKLRQAGLTRWREKAEVNVSKLRPPHKFCAWHPLPRLCVGVFVCVFMYDMRVDEAP